MITEIAFNPFRSPSEPEGQNQGMEITSDSGGKPLHLTDFMNMPLRAAVENLELSMMRKALEKAKYNQKKAARILGLTYDQFRGLRRKYSEKID